MKILYLGKNQTSWLLFKEKIFNLGLCKIESVYKQQALAKQQYLLYPDIAAFDCKHEIVCKHT